MQNLSSSKRLHEPVRSVDEKRLAPNRVRFQGDSATRFPIDHRDRRRWFRRVDRGLIGFQWCALGLTMIGLFVDPRAERALDRIAEIMTAPDSIQSVFTWWRPGNECLLIMSMAMIASTTSCFGTMVLPWIFGVPATIRRLLWVVTFSAVLCGVTSQRSSFAWLGYRYRTATYSHRLDALAIQLYRDWPSEDGEIDGLGPFTSYPFHDPSVLLLLSPFPLDGTDSVVTSIERDPAGGLLFQLGGHDDGAWLHWTASGGGPVVFTSGLMETRRPKRFNRLDQRWCVLCMQPN